MQNKYFDSCLYPKQSNLKEINNLFKINKKNYKALVHITNDKNLTKFKFVKDKKNSFFPLLHISKNEKILNQLKKIKQNNIKNIKVHPRFLEKKIDKNFNYYKKIFSFCEKNKINIFFCTFSGWKDEVLVNSDLDLISRLANTLKKSKLILMHSGGTNILSYYERFRFKENIFLDLSYTLQHFKKTTLINDILFCIKNLDRRIIFGSDYPSKKMSEYFNSINFLKKKISKKKILNVTFKNLDLIIEK